MLCSLPNQFNRLFASQMFNIKTDSQHMSEATFHFFLQSFIMMEIIAIAQHTHDGNPLCIILHNSDSAKGYHATKVGGVLLGSHVVLFYNTERGLVASADGVHFMASHSAVEV